MTEKTELQGLALAAIELALEAMGVEIADDIVRVLVTRFGADIIQARLDYYKIGLTAADLEADKKFGAEPKTGK